MSQQKPNLGEAYRAFQTAHTTEANIIEMLYNEIVALETKNTELQVEILALKKKDEKEPKK